MQHNHELGMLTDDALVVLGARRDCQLYSRSPANRLWSMPASLDAVELEKDAISVFQTAEEVFTAAGVAPDPLPGSPACIRSPAAP